MDARILAMGRRTESKSSGVRTDCASVRRSCRFPIAASAEATSRAATDLSIELKPPLLLDQRESLPASAVGEGQWSCAYRAGLGVGSSVSVGGYRGHEHDDDRHAR